MHGLKREARPRIRSPGHPRLSYQRSKTWMAGSSPAMTRLRSRQRLLRRALGGLLEFLENAVALQLRQIVHEQHAVEVVDLVLDAGGIEPIRILLVQLAV